jgi:hypothetical protein
VTRRSDPRRPLVVRLVVAIGRLVKRIVVTIAEINSS